MAATSSGAGAADEQSKGWAKTSLACSRSAASELDIGAANSAGALVAAALALPGVMPATAAAEVAPDQAVVEFKYFDYRDWQPGADRMRVISPGLYLLKPLSGSLAIEGTLVYDSMSGASPLFFNTLSGASGEGVKDYRTAGDVRLTKYYDRVAVGLGAAMSTEQDFFSRAVSLDVRRASDDRNRTYAFGVARTWDRIDPTNFAVENEKRRTVDFLLGVTQALSTNSIVQSNVTYSTGRGYYDDPYKPGDTRPDSRRVFAWLTRVNQYLPAFDATLKFSYRLLRDSFGSVANALEVAWHQPLPEGWSVMPSLRYYTQSAADFYFDPPFPRGFVLGRSYTADTRLAAFGAFTPGIAVAKTLPDGWSVNLKLEYYRQDPDWRLGGSGSPGIQTFSARWIQAGFSKTF
ncbi:MAG: DUF3570 domain-containing protein [Betaproteobacteria bacterium]|nr:DUF3570 domain-containing protein [Betaproteobacteria bacterium]